MKYGIEQEFFVLNKEDKLVPAYAVTTNLDGNPVIGEVRTRIHDTILDCVFELKKLLYTEKEKLAKLGYKISTDYMVKVDDEFLKSLRKSKDFINKKDLEILEELSIYPDGEVGKVLDKGVFKVALQINFSNNKIFTYPEYEKITVDNKSKWESKQSSKSYSELFDYVSLISKLDKAFEKEINETDRIKGVYAIKTGELGNRIEYRSLPNNVNLNKIIEILK